ncbi:Uncharacterised protein [Yersinia intermedia]|nr:Uncharacterised protein [Yersinia intermedia]CNH17274.1 Uncharacterised protein [Yersinia intermedia]CNK14286.1 Uncharacterised protein [Yersinia frederiksenii]
MVVGGTVVEYSPLMPLCYQINFLAGYVSPHNFKVCPFFGYQYDLYRMAVLFIGGEG